MTYYVVEIAEGAESITGKAIYEYATRNEAVANFHSKLGTAMKSPLFKTDLLMVINSAGGVEMAEKYVSDTYEEVE